MAPFLDRWKAVEQRGPRRRWVATLQPPMWSRSPMPHQSSQHGTTGADQPKDHGVAPGLFNALKEAGTQWLKHKSPKAGASLAYYSVFSMGPLIIVVISIAALVFQREGVERQ